MDTKVRLGVIGIGNMGSEHCRTLLSGQTPQLALTAVADLRAQRRANRVLSGIVGALSLTVLLCLVVIVSIVGEVSVNRWLSNEKMVEE